MKKYSRPLLKIIDKLGMMLISLIVVFTFVIIAYSISYVLRVNRKLYNKVQKVKEWLMWAPVLRPLINLYFISTFK